jgi:predicted  nucleic acid-binding Zn-ribbon protein
VATEKPDPSSRPEDDDYDLLTYGEATARLAEEIAKARRRLDELEQQSADSGTEAAAVRQRIDDLEAAASRQAAQQREARDFERFFGFSPESDGEGKA